MMFIQRIQVVSNRTESETKEDKTTKRNDKHARNCYTFFFLYRGCCRRRSRRGGRRQKCCIRCSSHSILFEVRENMCEQKRENHEEIRRKST